MKTTLTVITLLAGAASGYSQGQIIFNAYNSSLRQAVYNTQAQAGNYQVTYGGYTVTETVGSSPNTLTSAELPAGTTTYAAGTKLSGYGYSAELLVGPAGITYVNGTVAGVGLLPFGGDGNVGGTIANFYTSSARRIGFIQSGTTFALPTESYFAPGVPVSVAIAAWNNGGGEYDTLAEAQAAGQPWGVSPVVQTAALSSTGPISLPATLESFSLGLEVMSGPAQFTTQPQSVLVDAYNNASFAVTVQGSTPLSYQWQCNGTNLSDGANIDGSTNRVLNLADVATNQSGTYTVVVSNVFGAITSSPALLNVQFILFNVNGAPAVGTNNAVASAEVTITGGYPDGFLFYTIDGSTPTVSSSLYTGPFTLTNSAVLQALSVSADFSMRTLANPVTVNIVPVYNVQTSASGGGSISLNPASGPFASNSVVTLTANAAANWAFDYWTGGVTGSQNPTSVTMNEPLTVQAVFIPTAYPLTAGTVGGGSVTVNGEVISPDTYYAIGDVVNLGATASNGWIFLGWAGDASGTNNPLSVTMNETNDIEAVFGTVVATNTVGGGSIVLNQANPIPYGTTLTASAVPNPGKYLVTWSGAASGTNAPTAVLVTNASPAIDALFTSLPGGKYSLAVVVEGNGSVAISPQQNYYNPNDSVTLSASTTNAGTSFYGWTGNASGSDNPLVVTMNNNMVVQANFGALPSVNITPQNLIVFAGSNAVLTANAAGLPPLSFQWQDSEGPIAGQTNDTFTIDNAQATNSGNYSVVVSNPFGSVTSAVATVTVVFPPSISSQPAPQIVVAGSSLTLSVSADGTAPLDYQWQNSAGAIEGATNSSLILDPALTNYTDSYWVGVSNAYGVVTSEAAAVVVYAPVTIEFQPNSLVLPNRGSATFDVTATGFPTPLSYQWSLNGTNLAGATSNSLTITNVQLTNLGAYQVIVSNLYSFTNSDIATLNMSPSLSSPFAGATTIWGTSATLSVGAIGSGQLDYQWYVNGVPINGATNPTLDFTSVQFTNGGLYTVVVSSPYGSVTNTPEQVVVNPAGVSLVFSPTLIISGVVGYNYIIQSSSNLSNTNSWATLTNLTLTQPVQIWVDTNVDASSPFNSMHYYQVLPGTQ